MLKLPRTLHIEGSKGGEDPDATEFRKLNGEFLVVEEKVDGSGVSMSLDSDLNLKVYHRGSEANSKEFLQLRMWVATYQDKLYDLLEDRYELFGEWMFHKHTVFYDRLPSFFLESDIYDRRMNIWLSTTARMGLLAGHDYIVSVPVLAAFKPSSLEQLTSLVSKPKYQSDTWKESLTSSCNKCKLDVNTVLSQTDQSGLMEGLYIKHESDRHVIGRYKYVREGFLQTILDSDSHVRDRPALYNKKLITY